MKDSGSLLFPRLGALNGKMIIAERGGLSLLQLEKLGAVTHPQAAPGAVAGTPATVGLIRDVQEGIRGIAREAGYPKSMNGRLFDTECARFLYETLKIVGSEAAEDGVWTFLSVVVVPEIAAWRFPKKSEERVLGKPRNVLRRLWWRAWAFGPDLGAAPDGCTPLGEDELVQIMERPTVSGRPETAQAIRRALWRAEIAGLPASRSYLNREIAQRARAIQTQISFEALTEDQFDSLLDELAVEAGPVALKKERIKKAADKKKPAKKQPKKSK
jgi:hypothetical protein